MKPISIANDIFYVGVNDRRKALFENMLPLPYGVAYNSYIVRDERIALIDTVECPFGETLIERIKSAIGDRQPDYLIVNHMEPDHSSSILTVRSAFPNIKLVGNAKTLSMLKGYYGIDDGTLEVKDGDKLSLGQHTLQFFLTPMVHWPEVMVTYDVEHHTLFSADAFGCFGTLDGAVLDTDLDTEKYFAEMYRYYANIVGKYGLPVQNALKKLNALPIHMICSTHGPVWTEQIPKVLNIYDRLSRYEGEQGIVIVYGSMYGHTEEMAEAVARGAVKVCKNVRLYNCSHTDASILVSEIFRYKGLIVGTPTYCNGLYPNIASLLQKLEVRGLQNRVFGMFTSYSWANSAERDIKAFAERMKWPTPYAVQVKQRMTDTDAEALESLGQTIAENI